MKDIDIGYPFLWNRRIGRFTQTGPANEFRKTMRELPPWDAQGRDIVIC